MRFCLNLFGKTAVAFMLVWGCAHGFASENTLAAKALSVPENAQKSTSESGFDNPLPPQAEKEIQKRDPAPDVKFINSLDIAAPAEKQYGWYSFGAVFILLVLVMFLMA
jgi:hypothetical protein